MRGSTCDCTVGSCRVELGGAASSMATGSPSRPRDSRAAAVILTRAAHTPLRLPPTVDTLDTVRARSAYALPEASSIYAMMAFVRRGEGLCGTGRGGLGEVRWRSPMGQRTARQMRLRDERVAAPPSESVAWRRAGAARLHRATAGVTACAVAGARCACKRRQGAGARRTEAISFLHVSREATR